MSTSNLNNEPGLLIKTLLSQHKTIYVDMWTICAKAKTLFLKNEFSKMSLSVNPQQRECIESVMKEVVICQLFQQDNNDR